MDRLVSLLLSPALLGKLVRHLAGSATAGLVTHGFITGDDQTALVGAIGVIFTVTWTAIAHMKAAPAVPANPTTGGLL